MQSSLCGACTEACPVKIPLHELLHKHRQVIVEREGKAPISEKLMMKAFGLGAASSGLYDFGSKIASTAAKPFLKNEKITKGPGPLKAWTESVIFQHRTKSALETGLKIIRKGWILDGRNHSKS